MTRIPLLAHRDPRDIVAYRGVEPIPAGRFLDDVARAADRLPAARYVINLCSDRYRFAVGFAAALCRGQTSLLPPGTAPELLERLAQDYPGARMLTDADASFDPAPPLRVERDAKAHHAAIPLIDAARIAVVAFTSGSTGRPLPQPKSWGSLAQGAVAEAAALQLEGLRHATLLGTVPAQHMYGLESTVLLALRNGLAFHAGRPLYPADVGAALAQVPEPRVLVTTPVHLRAVLAAQVDLPALRLIVCATAPLPRELAVQAETRCSVLQEIYGFTEAGMVATRRTAREANWRTLPGVHVREQAGQAWFGGGHVGNAVAATDVLDCLDPHTFVLRGRGADLVNVAGKRTSLATLNHELAGIEGVEDGVFFMPQDAEGRVVRAMAFVVAPRLSRETLLAALRRRIDAAFLPRPLYFVDALPRNATGKLTRAALAALAVQCAASKASPNALPKASPSASPSASSGASPSASPSVSPSALPGQAAGAGVVVRLPCADHAVAQGHFPGDPLIPGAMLLDEVLRAAQARLGGTLPDWQIAWAKFASPARPGEDLRIRLLPREGHELAFECLVGERSVATGLLRRLAQPAARPAAP